MSPEYILFMICAAIILVAMAALAASRFYATFILVVVNFAVYAFLFFAAAWDGDTSGSGLLSGVNAGYLGFRPVYLISGDAWELSTLFWHLFAHGSWLHLLFNIIILFTVGMQLERKVKRPALTLTYFASGLGASLFYGALSITTGGSYGMSMYNYSIGASGAIFGLLGTYWAVYPNDRILFPLILIREWPVWLIAAVYFGAESALVVVNPGMGTNHAAHVGGFITGMAVSPLVRRLVPAGADTGEEAVKASEKDLAKLRRIARDNDLEELYRRIEEEDIPDIRAAWTEKLLRQADCPRCSGRVGARDGLARCDECGWRMRY